MRRVNRLEPCCLAGGTALLVQLEAVLALAGEVCFLGLVVILEQPFFEIKRLWHILIHDFGHFAFPVGTWLFLAYEFQGLLVYC